MPVCRWFFQTNNSLISHILSHILFTFQRVTSISTLVFLQYFKINGSECTSNQAVHSFWCQDNNGIVFYKLIPRTWFTCCICNLTVVYSVLLIGWNKNQKSKVNKVTSNTNWTVSVHSWKKTYFSKTKKME